MFYASKRFTYEVHTYVCTAASFYYVHWIIYNPYFDNTKQLCTCTLNICRRHEFARPVLFGGRFFRLRFLEEHPPLDVAQSPLMFLVLQTCRHVRGRCMVTKQAAAGVTARPLQGAHQIRRPSDATRSPLLELYISLLQVGSAPSLDEAAPDRALRHVSLGWG
jgi:hypothetical protein